MMKTRFIPLLLAVGLAGCGWPFDDDPEPLAFVRQVSLPHTAAELSTSGIEGELLNATQLTEQKRFEEARAIYMKLRDDQLSGSEGYNSLTASMAIEALLAGDMQTFRIDARELDNSLSKAVRVPNEHVEVIAIYRAITIGSIPVNTPPRLREWLLTLPIEPRPVQVADEVAR